MYTERKNLSMFRLLLIKQIQMYIVVFYLGFFIIRRVFIMITFKEIFFMKTQKKKLQIYQ